MSNHSQEDAGVERRRFVRIGNSSVMTCEEYSIPISEDKVDGLVSKNISAGGLLFESQREYPLGTVLRLEVSLQGWEKFKPEFYKPEDVSSSGPLIILGDVVRIEALAGGGYDVGVRITGIDEGHRLALEKYIKEAIRKVSC